MVDYKYKDLFTKSHVDKQLRIAADDGLFTAINPDINWENFELTESLCSESELRFGSCEASMVKFQIRNAFIPLSGKWLAITETLDGNADVPFQYGRYKVFSDVPTADKEYRDITAYDSMYDILDADMAAWYNSILPEENSTVSLRQFRTSFIRHFGLTEVVPEGGLVNDSMVVERTIQPEQISGKDIITAICEINGCFGHIGRDGKFHYIYLQQDIQGLYPADFLFPDHVPAQWDYLSQAETGHLYPQDPKGERMGTGRYIKCQYEDYVVRTINRLQIRMEENDIGKIWPETPPNGKNNCYIIENNFLVYGKSTEELDAIAENIYGKIRGIVYRPFNAECPGNPCFEVGDPLKFLTKHKIVESYILFRTFKGIQSIKDTYSSKGLERRAQNINSVQKSIIQLKGKANILTRTIEETKLEMKDMEEGLSNSIYATAKEIRAELQNTKSGLETTIAATAEGIRSDVSKTYETKIGAQTQYNSLSSSIRQTSEEISAEVNRATTAEGNLSSQLQLLGGQIVLKADANGRMVQVALNARPETGSEFKVDADNINLSANDVMNLMAGGTLNLSAMNINISSNNFSVDSQGNVVCNNLSAVTFTGQAINDLNNAIWNSETMRRVNEIIEMLDGKIGNIEQLLYNDKVFFDTLDGTGTYYWNLHSTTGYGGGKLEPSTALSPYTTFDATGYNKLVCRVKGTINGTPSGQETNWANLRLGITNDPEQGSIMVSKQAINGQVHQYYGPALNAWYDATFDLSGFGSKTALPINAFVSGFTMLLGNDLAHLDISRMALTNR